jgi:uncharacterized protein (DUF488 family)
MKIWTVGHSTRPAGEFIEILTAHRVALLADVRAFPASRRHPQFNRESLSAALAGAGIGYEHYPELGGLRKPKPGSRNTAWRNTSFRAYADYMETPEFEPGMARLTAAAGERSTAIMCAETLWWKCHRSLISDWLKWRGWEVLHIAGIGPAEEHPYTKAASIVEGRLSYTSAGSLFD